MKRRAECSGEVPPLRYASRVGSTEARGCIYSEERSTGHLENSELEAGVNRPRVHH
jgi:hypothetical protein